MQFISLIQSCKLILNDFKSLINYGKNLIYFNMLKLYYYNFNLLKLMYE